MIEGRQTVNSNPSVARSGSEAAPGTETLAAALELSLIPGMGTLAQNRLWNAVASPAELFGLTVESLRSFGIPGDVSAAFRTRRFRRMAEEILATVEAFGARCLVRGSPGYPPLLAEIYDPPLVLYARGDTSLLESPAIAVVGTRRPTIYGLQMAEGLGEDLAVRGVTVVSGMARGIDAAAHRGCLRVGGKTIAVFGCGIDVVYPREHARICNQILETGLVISEFVPGTSPSPQNFPVRNRLISGISLGTLVIEANEYSGSLITARVAMEQNREVFAVPGNITSPQSFGPNFLIRQGAKLVQTWRDIVEELPAEVRHAILVHESSSPRGTPELVMLSDDETLVLSCLENHEATQFDVLLHRSALPFSVLCNLLFNLEIRGWIRQLPGNLYVKLARPGK